MWWKLLSLTFMTCFELITGFSGGAGTTACFTMMPGHLQNVPQTIPAPVTVTTVGNTFRQGQNITLTLQSVGDFTFAGFLVQVRSFTDNQIVGRFNLAPGMRSVNCEPLPPNSVVTHVNNSPKVRVDFIWQVPEGFVGIISFQ